MFRDSTVLIVGAGGSADFGIPTGANILDDLIREPSYSQTENYNIYRDIFSADFMSFVSSNVLGLDPNAAHIFIEKAKKDFAPSIDLYAYHNEEVLEISKLYGARKIYSGLYASSLTRNLSESDDRLSDTKTGGPSYAWRSPRQEQEFSWIARLVQKYANGCDSIEDLKKNKLKVVTFNYDTIFEDAFYHILKGASRYGNVEPIHCPTVYHVYGKFPEMKHTISAADILEASKNIKYMYEPDTNDFEEMNTTLLNIRQAVQDANYIYIIGFAADLKNSDRIGLQKSHAKKFALNFDGNEGLNSRLHDLSVEPNCIWKGATKLACANGFFDLAESFPRPDYRIRTLN